jgi:hypothetical protein
MGESNVGGDENAVIISLNKEFKNLVTDIDARHNWFTLAVYRKPFHWRKCCAARLLNQNKNPRMLK